MRRWLGLFCLLAALTSTTSVAADKARRGEKPPARPGTAHRIEKANKQPKSSPGFTPERQAAAIAFARRHHPALARLLVHLKRAETREYQRAIRALLRTNDHLAQIRQRNAEQYERALEAWKLKSRIQLLVARIRMTQTGTAPENETLRRKLKQALVEQSDLRRAQLVEERKRVADRLKRLDAQIERMQKERDSQAEKQLELLTRPKKKGTGQKKRNRGNTAAGGKRDRSAADALKPPKKPTRPKSVPKPANPS